MKHKNFENKVVWVTGASAGIGEAMVNKFAREGAKVILTARREEELRRVAKNAGLNEDTSLILVADVTDYKRAPEWVSTIIEKFGRIDVMVHNAGVSQRGYIKDTDFEVYQKLINVDFLSTVAITKAVLPGMISQKAGHFIVVSSVAGKIGTIMRSGYCAAKHALHGFYDSLRAEYYNDNIGVTILCPGFVRTDISLNALDEHGKNHGKMDGNQANGISPATVARKAVEAVLANKKEIYIGGLKETAAVYLKRYFPSILFDQVRKNVPK